MHLETMIANDPTHLVFTAPQKMGSHGHNVRCFGPGFADHNGTGTISEQSVRRNLPGVEAILKVQTAEFG
jgi:hypothetical protein